ncbi:unnamed protein product [Dibothriocephalus latus]|uniref:Uncharacterized protein n=1 Tax=Dibothriocephalus latus TaxID=60516 RepID=A0A3P7NRK2_DIBLA|nr:unnamed protein product [Dibothriocephalus latus]
MKTSHLENAAETAITKSSVPTAKKDDAIELKLANFSVLLPVLPDLSPPARVSCQHSVAFSC